jgi:hypothetical protein
VPGPPGVACGPCVKSRLACSFASSAASSASSSTRSLKRSKGGFRAPSPSFSKRARPSPAVVPSPLPVVTAPLAPAPALAASSSSVPSMPEGSTSVEALLFGTPFVPGAPDSPTSRYLVWRSELVAAAHEYCASRNAVDSAAAALALARSRLGSAGHRYDSAVASFASAAGAVHPGVSISGVTPFSVAGYVEGLPAAPLEPAPSESRAGGVGESSEEWGGLGVGGVSSGGSDGGSAAGSPMDL